MTTREATGYIGPQLRLSGRLTGEGDMEIDGRFGGELTLRGTLVVGRDGTLTGPARVQAAEVSGSVTGDVTARESVHVREGGRIEGDVRAPRVAIDDGGLLSGGIYMDFEVPEPAADPALFREEA